MIRLAVLAVLALSACGVDGPPKRPVEQPFQQQMGVTFSGDATLGVQARL